MDPGLDDQIRLQKYYAQIIAGMTNPQIIVDPDGFVPIGGTAVEPYPLTHGQPPRAPAGPAGPGVARAGRRRVEEPFTREELRTVAVWTRGDDRVNDASS